MVHARGMTQRATVSLGVAASIGPESAAQLAPLVEAAGFRALWVNDTPGADALEVLAAAARTTQRLILATGVLPIDRRSVAQIAATSRPATFRRIGSCSGSAPARSSGARSHWSGMPRPNCAPRSRRRSSSARSGRRCAASGSQHADGVLLSWLPPADARAQAAEAHACGTRLARRAVRARRPRSGRARATADRDRALRELPVVCGELRAPGDRPRRHGAGCRDAGCRDPRSPRAWMTTAGASTKSCCARSPSSDSLEDYRRFIDRARSLST